MIHSRYLRKDFTSRTFPSRDLFPSSLSVARIDCDRSSFSYGMWHDRIWLQRICNIITHKILSRASQRHINLNSSAFSFSAQCGTPIVMHYHVWAVFTYIKRSPALKHWSNNGQYNIWNQQRAFTPFRQKFRITIVPVTLQFTTYSFLHENRNSSANLS